MRDRDSLSYVLLLVLTGIFIVPLGTGSRTKSAQVGAVSQGLNVAETPASATSPRPLSAAVSCGMLELLANHFVLSKWNDGCRPTPATPGARASGDPQRRRLEQRARADAQLARIAQVVNRRAATVETLVAAVPDPLESHDAWTFDRFMDAMQRAIASDEFVLDGFGPDAWWRPAAGSRGDQGDKGDATPTSTIGRQHQYEPGVLLFRRKEQQLHANGAVSFTERLLLLFIVPEMASSGLRGFALQKALTSIEALCASGIPCTRVDASGTPLPLERPVAADVVTTRTSTPAKQDVSKQGDREAPVLVRMLGPSYSGSASSLAVALSEWLVARERRYHVTIVSGTADSNDNWTWLNFIAGCNPVTFQATVPLNGVVQEAMYRYLLAISGHQPHQRMALLVEGNTSYGQQMSHLPDDSRDDAAMRLRAAPQVGAAPHKKDSGKKDSRNQDSSCEEVRPSPLLTKSQIASFVSFARQPNTGDGSFDVTTIKFPMHISRLRNAAEQARTRQEPTIPGMPETLTTLVLGESGLPKDVVPPMTPELTNASVELMFSELMRYLRQERVRLVGLFGTDARDKLFLAQQVARWLPDATLFTLDSDLLFTHPKYSEALRGLIVASPYPLYVRTQSWTPHWPRVLTHIGADAAGQPDLKREFHSSSSQGVYNAMATLLGLTRDDLSPDVTGRLIDYGTPGAAGSTEPVTWISTVGRESIWPVAVYDPRDPVDPVEPRDTADTSKAGSTSDATASQTRQMPGVRGDASYVVAVAQPGGDASSRSNRGGSERGSGMRRPATADNAGAHDRAAAAAARTNWPLATSPWAIALFFALTAAGLLHAALYALGWLARWPGASASVREMWARHHLLHVLLASARQPIQQAQIVCIVTLWTFYALPLGLAQTRAAAGYPAWPLWLAAVCWIALTATCLAVVTQAVVPSIPLISSIASRAGDRRRRARPTRSLAQRLLHAAGLLLTLAAAVVIIGSFLQFVYTHTTGAPVRSTRMLFYERAVSLGNGVSPIGPLLSLAAACYAWGFMNLRRFAHECPVLAQPHRRAGWHFRFKLFDDVVGANAWALARRFASSRRDPVTSARPGPFLAALATALIVYLVAFTPAPIAVDGPPFVRAITMATLLLHLVVGLTLVQFLQLWFTLRGFLAGLATHPLAPAFEAIGRAHPGLIANGLASRAPTVAQLQLPAAYWPSLRAVAALAAAIPSHNGHGLGAPGADASAGGPLDRDVCAAPARLARTLDRLGDIAPALNGDAAHLLSPPDVRHGHAGGDMESASNVVWSRGDAFWREMLVAHRLLHVLPLFWARQDRLDEADARQPAPVRKAEEFVACLLTFAIQEVLSRLGIRLWFISSALLLLLAAHALYPLTRGDILNGFAWAYVLAAAGSALFVFAGISRDPILNRLKGRDASGHLKLDRELMTRVALYAGVPVLTLIATQFPGLARVLSEWLQPVQATLP